VLGPDRVDHVRRRRFADEQRAVAKLLQRFMLIVSTAPKLDVLGGPHSPACEWNDVVKLEECRFAASALAPFERTATAVARPDGAAHGRRDVTASGGERTRRLPRRLRLRQLRPLEMLEQQRQRAIDDRGGIAVRDRVTQQILRAPELVVRVAADGELHFVPLGAERRRNGNCGPGGSRRNRSCRRDRSRAGGNGGIHLRICSGRRRHAHGGVEPCRHRLGVAVCRRMRGKLSDHRRRVRPRCDRRDQAFDIALARVTCGVEPFVAVRLGEMRPQETQIRERELAALEPLQYDGKSPRRACRVDAAVRRVLRQPQDARALDEQGCATLAEIQPSRVHLGQRGDERRGRSPLALREPFDLGQKIAIGKILERACRRHVLVYHRLFRSLTMAQGAMNCARTAIDAARAPCVRWRTTTRF
jgi:hypothetical protein